MRCIDFLFLSIRHILLFFILFPYRRYGGLDGGRFCFEGGSRCGKGEGIHVLRLDEPSDLQNAFDCAAQGKLEAKRPKSGFFKSVQPNTNLSSNPSGSNKSGSKYINANLN